MNTNKHKKSEVKKVIIAIIFGAILAIVFAWYQNKENSSSMSPENMKFEPTYPPSQMRPPTGPPPIF
ncbi:MAG: hypothetical protein WC795_03305 [Candidatus Paceibacterota bacterium]